MPLQKKKLPSFPFYAADFISSLDVQVMTTAEVGAYILLLSNSWIQDDQGYLPDDEDILRRLCRMDENQWVSSKEIILKKFQKKDGKIFNARLLSESQKYRAYQKAQSENGKRGGRPSKEADKEGKQNKSEIKGVGLYGNKKGKAKKSFSPSPSPSLLKKEKKGSLRKNEFNEFYKSFPGTKSYTNDWKNLQKKFPDVEIGKLQEALKVEIKWRDDMERYNRWAEDNGKDKHLIPSWKHLQTWINKSSWEQVLPDVPKKGAGYRRKPTSVEPAKVLTAAEVQKRRDTAQMMREKVAEKFAMPSDSLATAK